MWHDECWRIVWSEPRCNDLGTPASPSVGPSVTEGTNGPQNRVVDDPVHAPSHYRKFPIEVIEITELLSFTLGNVVKYVLRADYKGKPLEDLKKARWYLDREIAQRERDTP